MGEKDLADIGPAQLSEPIRHSMAAIKQQYFGSGNYRQTSLGAVRIRFLCYGSRVVRAIPEIGYETRGSVAPAQTSCEPRACCHHSFGYLLFERYVLRTSYT
jgi:hypothetical protein